ncbi:diphthine--ammonia ligase [Natronococcus wangiae]|uniref:diphthine--ammonia ligase n=1 Tax=Natronococcus wangiae TaxID=3068275 RepID=UPI00273E0159|nr:diphthine--ammonia ligase [Natronococcus sp. AD5]
MTEPDGGWVALFSGGKESSWALCQALEANCDVRRLVIVHPPKGSHAYHAPATSVARLAAQSIGIPVVNVGLPAVDIEPPDIKMDIAPELETRDETEIEPLESALRTLDAELDGGLNGVIAGTVDSEYRADRLRSMCDDIGCDFFAPLWQADPRELLETMIDAGLEIVIIEVTAPGFDKSWLGRRLDRDALADLETLHRERGINLLGEGGEFDTIVIDGPHMSHSIALEFEREWYGTWGRVRITDARLEVFT